MGHNPFPAQTKVQGDLSSPAGGVSTKNNHKLGSFPKETLPVSSRGETEASGGGGWDGPRPEVGRSGGTSQVWQRGPGPAGRGLRTPEPRPVLSFSSAVRASALCWQQRSSLHIGSQAQAQASPQPPPAPNTPGPVGDAKLASLLSQASWWCSQRWHRPEFHQRTTN